ncbi:MAG TPA: AmmeMemoRadiSam system protein B [Candidatus Acidoferrales bacterium]|nr:AmmeMemoRadiSam system protein B [Candidatus Acidoferrales bacterium]
MIRQPAVAGRFYPAYPQELRERVQQFVGAAAVVEGLPKAAAPGVSTASVALACMVPHAGYVFSGAVAGAVYARIALPRRIIIIGPRHRPRGSDLAINAEGGWQTPLGLVQIDSDMARSLLATCPLLVEDHVAHRNEHSLEVQLPFLQVLTGEFRFVPIAIGTLDFRVLTELGHALAKVISASSEPVLLIVSTDMNHYESEEVTHVKDGLAIDQLLALDPRGLHETVRRERITMCGCGPAVAALTALHDLGVTRAELVRYATSADLLGDRDEVVGYAGMLFS